MNNQVKLNYQSLFEQHGRSVHAVQMSSTESQLNRFKTLLDISPTINSAIDVGCGLGDLFSLIKDKHPNCAYTGYDYLDSFVKDAATRFSSYKQAQFKCLDITAEPIQSNGDYIFISGMFNNKIENNREVVEDTILKLWNFAGKGLAFNGISTYVDYKDEHLYYQDPLQVFDFCKRYISPHITLRHDYDVKPDSIPFEFTIYAYKR